MISVFKKSIIVFLMLVASFVGMTSVAYAQPVSQANDSGSAVATKAAGANEDCILYGIPVLQGFCSSTNDLGTSTSISKTIAGIFTSFVYLFIIIVLVVGVIYTVKAALTYVQAEGDEKKVGAARASMKSVLFGVATMFLALIGLVLLQTLFKGDGTGGGLKGAIQSFLDSLTIFKK